MQDKKKVALVLASGGAKGFAHIGAIEALEECGYEITSIAGTSMGALIGGLYAAGGLDKVKEWMFDLTGSKVFSLVDFTFSSHALLKGNRLMEALKGRVPDCNIEELGIPFCAVATDLKQGQEVIFRQGSLYDAIRASISIPMLFRPVELGNMLLIDGGITNGLPLDRVVRTEGDTLVAVNLEDYEWDNEEEKSMSPTQKTSPFELLSRKFQAGLNALSNNYISLTYDTISILMKRNTEMSLRLTPPDIYLNVNLGEYGSYDYDEAEAIARLGHEQMLALLRGK
ncbi:MAG: patatin-like phospholipase family protein [Bacteroides sp.]|nr:patatin-like phospholipase family protein [Bacteroides sp.]MCM1448154.1 patatin-like phospholipase family protein [Bacteroides sp.]